MIKKRFFYLLSFPRCRSTWFSHFFKTNVSFCYHEMLSGNDTEAFNKHMKPLMFPHWNEAYHDNQTHYRYIGSADTNPISLGRTVRLYGPMVMILRPEEDVVNSLKKVFDPHPDFNLDEWNRYIRNMIDMYSIALEWYRENEPDLMVVNFEELEDVNVLKQIWNHCVPTARIDNNYIENLNNTRISVKRRQGLENGINASCKNMKKSIEQFKVDHLDKYDREKFRKDFWREPDDNPSGELYLGHKTEKAIANG